MRYGFHVPHMGPLAKPETLARAAGEAEAAGFESVWVSDHIMLPLEIKSAYPNNPAGRLALRATTDILDPIPTLAYLAAVTKTARIGVSVLVIPYRQPVLQAKMLATLDVLSQGRLILGAGTGWLAEEFTLVGAPPVTKRGKATDEYLQAMKVLWTEPDPTFDGEFVRFRDVKMEPKPVQKPHIPIWVGGHSPAALRRAARLGDGYHASRRSPSQLKDLFAALQEECERSGRAYQTLPRSMRLAVRFAESPTGADLEGPDGASYGLAGTVEEIVNRIGDYTAAGAQKLVIETTSRSLDDVLRFVERFAREVMPRTQKGSGDGPKNPAD